MQLNDMIQANASLDNLRQNLDMKHFAKEVLLEENYERFMKSYRFTFWFQILGTIGGFLIPSVILILIFHDVVFAAFGAVIGVVWMIMWMILSHFMPQARIYMKFSKWYRKSGGSVQDLEEIFYQK